MISQPSPPDPYQTAQAQTQSNEQTADYQSQLNDVSQITPYGNITYNQTGTSSSGAPEETATTTLAPDEQALSDKTIANATGSANLAGQLENTASSTLSNPLDLSYSALQGQLDKENEFTMDPQWARNDAQTQQTAYDQGLAPGSAGYTTAISNEGLLKDNAYASAFGQDASQAQSALTSEYNEPLNALSSLETGSQVSQPGVGTLAPTSQTGVAPTNVAGIVEQNYQQQVAQSNAAMGGLFGLGSSGIGLLGALA